MTLAPMPYSNPIRRALRYVLVDRHRAELRACVGEARALERLDAEQTAEMQRQRLAHILTHAAAHVPYYRDLLPRHGVVDTSGNARPERLAALPLLDKATLAEEFERLRSDDADTRGWVVNRSGGSTGEPTRFVQDRRYRAWAEAVKVVRDEWAGVRPGDRQALLWGSARDLFEGSEAWKTRLRRWSLNELWVNAFFASEQAMASHLVQLQRFRPSYLLGYAPNLHEFALFAERRGARLASLQSVASGAGTLHPHMRDDIERAFGVPVFNRYGSREFGAIAGDCEFRTGLHVAAPHVIVEVVRPDGSRADPHESGEIVVSSLTNFSMPLLRYRIGDRGATSSRTCACGCGWPLLDRVEGRVTDTFVHPDGGVVSPTGLVHLAGALVREGWVRRFQFVQETVEEVTVRIVPEGDIATAAERHAEAAGDLTHAVRKMMGPRSRIRIEFVETIPPSPSGKHLSTICKVKAPQDAPTR